jgi:hypothetical protein
MASSFNQDYFKVQGSAVEDRDRAKRDKDARRGAKAAVPPAPRAPKRKAARRPAPGAAAPPKKRRAARRPAGPRVHRIKPAPPRAVEIEEERFDVANEPIVDLNFPSPTRVLGAVLFGLPLWGIRRVFDVVTRVRRAFAARR